MKLNFYEADISRLENKYSKLFEERAMKKRQMQKIKEQLYKLYKKRG